jgi:hypothetical protein
MSEADQLAVIVKRAPHSFRAIRSHTKLKLSDEQFYKLVKDNPHRFKIVRFANKGEQANEIKSNRPGVKLIGS